jgi:hypothetical protein
MADSIVAGGRSKFGLSWATVRFLQSYPIPPISNAQHLPDTLGHPRESQEHWLTPSVLAISRNFD